MALLRLWVVELLSYGTTTDGHCLTEQRPLAARDLFVFGRKASVTFQATTITTAVLLTIGPNGLVDWKFYGRILQTLATTRALLGEANQLQSAYSFLKVNSSFFFLPYSRFEYFLILCYV